MRSEKCNEIFINTINGFISSNSARTWLHPFVLNHIRCHKARLASSSWPNPGFLDRWRGQWPMTGAEIILLLLVEGWFAINSLHGRSWPILLAHSRLNYECRISSNSEMISPQVVLFTLIEFGSQVGCIAFIVEIQISWRCVVLFQLREGLWSSVTVFKVVCLNVVNEVLVNLLMSICFRLVHFGIRCDKVCIMSFAQHQMGALGSNILIL